jgi:hypothetical protein
LSPKTWSPRMRSGAAPTGLIRWDRSMATEPSFAACLPNAR